jgi:hypothetical protein
VKSPLTITEMRIEGERVTPLMRVEAGWGVRGDDVAVSFVGHTQGLKRRSAVHRLPRIVERRNTAAVRAGAAGIVIFSVALAVLTVCWPSSRWLGNFTDLASPRDLVSVALANSIVLVAAYLAIAALVWASLTRRCLDPVISVCSLQMRPRTARGVSRTCRIFTS